MQNQEHIGIDFGRVIMCAVKDGVEDTSFLGRSFADAMKTPATPGALDCIAKLVERYGGRVSVVSKCGESVENKTRAWLGRNDVYAATGLAKEQVHFCRKRHEKAPICRRLGITHFIDDRVDVLSHMVGIVPNLYLFGEQRAGTLPPWAEPVLDWEQVAGRLL
ncbi:MAG: hypothetical protein KJO07_04135 [Deltaproteobacteria bacterium]|nr:hypothetical protein [Deltaproteobacteria bacterium]